MKESGHWLSNKQTLSLIKVYCLRFEAILLVLILLVVFILFIRWYNCLRLGLSANWKRQISETHGRFCRKSVCGTGTADNRFNRPKQGASFYWRWKEIMVGWRSINLQCSLDLKALWSVWSILEAEHWTKLMAFAITLFYFILFYLSLQPYSFL